MSEQTPHKVIKLREFEPLMLGRAEISESTARLIWEKFEKYVNVDFPSPKTDYTWKLTSRGFVGIIPIDDTLTLELAPKAPIRSIFGMLEYAYNLKSIEFFRGMTRAAEVGQVYEILARLLARRVIDRTRKGLYRDYVESAEHLPYVRGRVQPRAMLAAQDPSRIPCQFEENTLDNIDNKIAACALDRILRSGFGSDETRAVVRRAFTPLQGVVALDALDISKVSHRIYHRLNQDYEQIHALSRFFLENTGPTHASGNQRMIPFVLNMPRLYERFVAEWLKAHAPSDLVVRSKHLVHLGENGQIRFELDLLLSDATTGGPKFVLDTKYKAGGTLGSSDVAQVVAYATAKSCARAVLVYPKLEGGHPAIKAGNVTVSAITFSIDGDLEEAGREFLAQLLRSDSSLGVRALDTS